MLSGVCTGDCTRARRYTQLELPGALYRGPRCALSIAPGALQEIMDAGVTRIYTVCLVECALLVLSHLEFSTKKSVGLSDAFILGFNFGFGVCIEIITLKEMVAVELGDQGLPR